MQDIPSLVEYFVRKCSVRFNKPIDLIPHEVMERPPGADWPGNIRELQRPETAGRELVERWQGEMQLRIARGGTFVLVERARAAFAKSHR